MKNKSWEYFLKNPAPQGMPNWHVLNTAISGNAAGFFVNSVQNCLSDLSSKNAKTFRDTAPHRVWMEIGGNDFRYLSILSLNPHWAHYVNNSILNNVGKMVASFQKNGRTVLLMGYHSLKAENVVKNEIKNGDLLERLCGTEAVRKVDLVTGSCVLTNGLVELGTGITRGIFDNINLMADDVHPNDAGYSMYAPVIARKFKSLQYDTVPSDYNFSTNN